jgi:hypothetical protein
MSSSTKYCWVADLKKGTFLANSRESVRVMGVLTAVAEIPDEDAALLAPLMMRPRCRHNNTNSTHHDIGSTKRNPLTSSVSSETTNDNRFLSVTMDDGTDSINFWAPERMIKSSSLTLEIGKTYDCMMKLHQSSSAKQWFAETLILIRNPIDEQCRWMELSHHDQQSRSPSSKLQYSNLSHKLGFPVRRRDATEIHRLIRLHAQSQQHQHQQHQHQLKRSNQSKQKRNVYPRWRQNQQRQPLQQHSNINNNNNSATSKEYPSPKSPPPPAQHLEGILLEDLATVLQKPQREIQEMTEELQLDGKIYQNERGEYLPI